jgi:nicotinamide-nucleotide amidase
MWGMALETEALRQALAGAGEFRWRIMRLFGIPESEIAATLVEIEGEGVDLAPLEITTCLRRGEIEIATRYAPEADPVYERFAERVAERHADTIFSRDGTTLDEQVAALLAGPPAQTVATAESCTGGLLAARLTERAGSSAYVLGGLVVYSNEAKSELAGVDPGLIERVGAVSVEVAEALADGARARLGADYGIGITGIAGPGGGSEDKPVGTVCFSIHEQGGQTLTRRTVLPGNRSDIRDRSTTVAMHLLRRVLMSG